MREFFRKFLVSLKRRPQNIPLVLLVIAFLEYSLNLTKISNTTARIQGSNMGLCGFITMLFSILVFVVFLNAFPKRQKANIPLLVLMYAIYAMIIAADIFYRMRVREAIANPNFASALASSEYIYQAETVLTWHIILVAAVAVLIALLPIYSKWLRKINTSIDVDDNGKLDAIDISGED